MFVVYFPLKHSHLFCTSEIKILVLLHVKRWVFAQLCFVFLYVVSAMVQLSSGCRHKSEREIYGASVCLRCLSSLFFPTVCHVCSREQGFALHTLVRVIYTTSHALTPIIQTYSSKPFAAHYPILSDITLLTHTITGVRGGVCVWCGLVLLGHSRATVFGLLCSVIFTSGREAPCLSSLVHVRRVSKYYSERLSEMEVAEVCRWSGPSPAASNGLFEVSGCD